MISVLRQPTSRFIRQGALALLACIIGVLVIRSATAGIKEGGPDKLSDTKSLGALIQESNNRPVHIIFVHGMRTNGPGASSIFRQGLCQYVAGGCQLKDGYPTTGVRSEPFDIGKYPSDANVVDQKIWPTPAAWSASRPFVDRFVYVSPTGKQIVVDEVNWWPLLFPWSNCADLGKYSTRDLGVVGRVCRRGLRDRRAGHGGSPGHQYGPAESGFGRCC